MLCSHITLKTPTKPQLSMQYTTTTYAIFLQPLPVPSSLSVNNPPWSCLSDSHKNPGNTRMYLEKRM